MVEVGDKVICINNKNVRNKINKLSLDKIYTIAEIRVETEYSFYRFEESIFKYKIIFYNTQMFVSLLEYRRLKIEKIINKMNDHTTMGI